MVDKKALRSMGYGVYIVSAVSNGRSAGCVVNTLTQVTSQPAQVSVAVNKQNVTSQVIADAGRFEAAVLAQDATMELIGLFGFQSSANVDKFAQAEHRLDEAGIPYVSEQAVAHMGARVVNTVDLGTHLLFIGEVEEAEVLSDAEPLTYAYYHQVKGGKTPPKASSYQEEEPAAPAVEPAPAPTARIGWKCRICGFVIEADELPEDFKCPVCGVGREFFDRVELPA